MFIEIEDLGPEPLCVEHSYGVDALGFDHDDAALDRPVSARFTLTHKEKDLRVEGRVETGIRYSCARCLGEFVRLLATDFELQYLPQPEGMAGDEEIELSDGDLNIGFYDGVRLDVDLMVLEQIELALPMKFICRDDCKGLCPKCGTDLNTRSCGCIRDEADSRLDVLREFRKRMDG